eukprot:980087-Prymnesium_polylepis.1
MKSYSCFRSVQADSGEFEQPSFRLALPWTPRCKVAAAAAAATHTATGESYDAFDVTAPAREEAFDAPLPASAAAHDIAHSDD